MDSDIDIEYTDFDEPDSTPDFFESVNREKNDIFTYSDSDGDWFDTLDDAFSQLEEYVIHSGLPLLNHPFARTNFISRFYPRYN